MERTEKDAGLGFVIGLIMRWGVIISIAITVIGGVIFLFRHENERVSYQVYIEQDQSVNELFTTTFNELFQLKGRAIIMLGILLLFSTPIIRVLFSLIDFIYQKDIIYTIVTLLVLFIIFLSLSGVLVHY